MVSEISNSENIRPGIVDSDYSTFEQAIRVSSLDVSDIPPYFFDTSENRSSKIDWNESGGDTGRPHQINRGEGRKVGVASSSLNTLVQTS